MNIRDVRITDYKVVEQMMQGVHTLHVKHRPDMYINQSPILTETDFQTMVQDENCLFVLAEDSQGILGLCQVKIKAKSGQMTCTTAYMDVLYVNEASRGKGVGKQLFSHVSALAKDKGATRLDLMVWSFNEGALKFYEELGLTPQRYILEKNLD